MALTIRPGRPEQRTVLEALQRRASLAVPEDSALLLANPDAIVLPEALLAAGLVHVAEEDGVVAGFAVAWPRDDGDVELDGLFVDPEHWRSGIGAALVRHIATRAIAAGAPGIIAVGNERALPFYAALGFRRIGTAETRFGPAPLLRRTLT